jgi:hypothetical protein
VQRLLFGLRSGENGRGRVVSTLRIFKKYRRILILRIGILATCSGYALHAFDKEKEGKPWVNSLKMAVLEDNV